MTRLVTIALLLSPLAAAPTTFYVAPNGNDQSAGTAAQPLATLQGARDAIRKLRQAGPLPAGGVTVLVQPGSYEVTQTLVFDAQDAGTPDAPVVYRAAKPGQATIRGGRAITGWQIDHGQVLKADVGAQGFAGNYFRQLICNGRRMDLARYPNADHAHYVTGGWAYADGDPIPMYKAIPDEPKNVLQYQPEDQRDWARPAEAEAFVFPRYNWWNNIVRIKSIDGATRTITLAANASYGIRPGDRYYIRNVREELDAPGEWYLDRETWTLYFQPPADADPKTMVVHAPAVRTILDLQAGAANLTFRGFVIECAEGTAITMKETTDCQLAGCVIRNVGDYDGSGVTIGGGHRNGVVGCDIHDVGRDGIRLDGGSYETLEPAENYADNNYLHHTGVCYKQGVGVGLGGVGNRASHNLIHDCPRFGIVWGGNDQVIEYNHIRHVDLETADCGAIYSWQVNWARRGTEIRYNYLHDVIGFGMEGGQWVSPHMNWGIYLDDGTCGTHVHGNLVVRNIRGGVNIHGGRDNLIENNILVDSRDSEMSYSGYGGPGHPYPMMVDHWNQFHGTDAYLKYPGYAPLLQNLEFAWQLAGNKFLRNIVSYREPTAKLFYVGNLPFDQTESDHNLIWHDGLPLLTGQTMVDGLTGQNLAPNPGFEEGEEGQLPTDWHLQVRPNDSQAAIDPAEHVAGQQSARVDGRGTSTDASGQHLPINFVSAKIPLEPGQTYQMSASIKAASPDTLFTFTPQCYLPGKFFWGRGQRFKAGTDWQRYEVVFKLPQPGDSNFKEGMDFCVIRIDVPQGTLWVDEVELKEAKVLSEWEAWQAKGLDQHSQVADPKFVDRAHDDYRLQPDSPAFKLGFKPLPYDQMGPYQDELRASWPIVEAEGAREQMTFDWSKH